MMLTRRDFLAGLATASAAGISGCGDSPQFQLLNASYDPTRELYRKLNRRFIEQLLASGGPRVQIRQSHGGSGSQSRAVQDGLPADLVSLAMWTDLDAIRKKGMLANDWQDRLPNRSLPYFSTIVFAVRKGNPHGIQDWNDLVEKPGVKLVTANPKTGGGAKLNLLAAWGAVLLKGGSEKDARDYVAEMYRRTPVLDSGARGATVTFARRFIGDVHLTWENEARLEAEELKDDLELVYPTSSIRAEPYVAVVDAVVDRKGTREITEKYAQFLYSPDGQRVIADNFYRPSDPAIAEESKSKFPALKLQKIEEIVPGGWAEAQKKFFADGAIFDQLYQG
jgi:sulfate/thiosulfate transport system substrate-binding protein